MSRSPTVVLAVACLLALAGCDTTVNNHGHRLVDDDLVRIRPGVTSRGEVIALLGSPSARASFDDDTWYYVGRRMEERTFYSRTLAAQDVVRVRFDETGTVAELDRFALADGREVAPNGDTTPTGGNDITIVQQFIGNIGRFNPPGG